jgi:hypothetical protein
MKDEANSCCKLDVLTCTLLLLTDHTTINNHLELPSDVFACLNLKLSANTENEALYVQST